MSHSTIADRGLGSDLNRHTFESQSNALPLALPRHEITQPAEHNEK